MEPYELNRMFDRLAPTAEQEADGLDRLLHEERKGRPMKKLKKLTVLVVAAALMVVSVAAAGLTGLDQRLMEHFGAGSDQEAWLAAAVAADEPVTHNYPSGWTVQVGQVLADRYMVSVVLDFTVPPDIDLSALVEQEGEFEPIIEHSLDNKDGVVIRNAVYFPRGFPEIVEPADGREFSFGRALVSYEKEESYPSGMAHEYFEILESSDFKQGHLSILWTIHKGLNFMEAVEDDMLGARLRLSPKGLWFKEANKMLYMRGSEEAWTYELVLPDTDPGKIYTTKYPIQIESKELEIQKIYLSPLELSYDIYHAYDWDARMKGDLLCFPTHRDSLDYTLNLSDGTVISMKPGIGCETTGEQSPESCWSLYHVTVHPEQLIDPAQVTSVTIYGQTYELK